MSRYGYPPRSCLWVRLGFVYVVLGLGQPVVVWECTFPTYSFISCTTRHQRTSLLSPHTTEGAVKVFLRWTAPTPKTA